MSTVNVTAREVAAKIVYYGPGLSGKTTNLKNIYETVKPTSRGEMVALATEGDRTLFFDFLPVKVERIRDFTLRLGLYTVPGQVFYNATRKLVLQGADGVVFVADSQLDAIDRNVESLENLVDNLRDEGIDVSEFPLVLQWNKRDLKNTLPLDRLHSSLNRWASPEFEASATEGRGVLETLKAITRLVIRDLKFRGVVGSNDPPARPPSSEIRLPPAGSTLENQIQAHLMDQQAAQDQQPYSAPRPISRSGLATARPRTVGPDLALVEPGPDNMTLPLPLPPELSSNVVADGGVGADPGVGVNGEYGNPGSFLLALAPISWRQSVAEAEACFAAGQYEVCIRAAVEVIQALGGHADPIVGAYLMGLDGREVRTLFDLTATPSRSRAATALYLLAQACVRAR